MSIQENDATTDPRWTLAVGAGVVVALLAGVFLGAPMLRGADDADSQNLSATQLAELGYEDAAVRLIAGVWDSSFGPTVVDIDGKVEPAPGSSDADITLAADHSAVDVDARTERTSEAHERTTVIAKTVPMTGTGRISVSSLISAQRAIAERATAESAEGDIVAMTVEPKSIEGRLSDSESGHWVEVTLAVTEEYRSGVVSEGEETAIVVFDPDSHEVIDAALYTAR